MATFVTYELVVTAPAAGDMDESLCAEILENAEPHDTYWSAKVARYVGAHVSDTEDFLNGALPDGWGVTIRELHARV